LKQATDNQKQRYVILKEKIMKLYIALYRAGAVRDTQVCKLNQDSLPDNAWDDEFWENVEDAEVFIGTFSAETTAEAVRMAAGQEGCDETAIRVIEAAMTECSNEPYAVDELKQIAGKPYYHVGLQKDSPPPHWQILDKEVAKRPTDYFYGKYWLAYRCEV